MSTPPLWSPLAQHRLYDELGYRRGHPEQDRLLFDWEHRYHVLACPRRSSKSWTVAKKALPLVLGRKAKADGTGPEPTRTWIVGPTYDLAEKEFRYLWEDIVEEGVQRGWWPKMKYSRYNKASGDLFFVTPWDSVVQAKSADKPQALLGEAVDCVILSEAAQLPQDIWTRYLQPTLATTQGYALFPTTPDASAQWLYDLWGRGLSGDELIASYTWPVSGNPAYPLEEFEAQRRFYGPAHPVFREQYLGEWVFHTGTVYGGEFSPTRTLIDPYDIPQSWRRIRAIDFGYRDPFVCLWFVLTPDSELHLYREYYVAGQPMAEHARAIRELTKDEPVWYSVADSSEPQSIADLRRYGVPAIEANRDRRAGRMLVGDFLRSGRLKLIKGACPETIREFQFFRWAPDADREGSKEKTVGDDHAMDALRYAIMSRPQPPHRPLSAAVGSFEWEMAKRRRERTQRLYPIYHHA